MYQPPGFYHSKHPNYVCLLQKSLYGLKQAPRAWSHWFTEFITRVSFINSKLDSSLFTYTDGTSTSFLLLYVYDIILTAFLVGLIRRIISLLSTELSMIDLGNLSYFLGI